jgi:hypothetical protein
MALLLIFAVVDTEGSPSLAKCHYILILNDIHKNFVSNCDVEDSHVKSNFVQSWPLWLHYLVMMKMLSHLSFSSEISLQSALDVSILLLPSYFNCPESEKILLLDSQLSSYLENCSDQLTIERSLSSPSQYLALQSP